MPRMLCPPTVLTARLLKKSQRSRKQKWQRKNRKRRKALMTGVTSRVLVRKRKREVVVAVPGEKALTSTLMKTQKPRKLNLYLTLSPVFLAIHYHYCIRWLSQHFCGCSMMRLSWQKLMESRFKISSTTFCGLWLLYRFKSRLILFAITLWSSITICRFTTILITWPSDLRPEKQCGKGTSLS
jgi:hypothetical protein